LIEQAGRSPFEPQQNALAIRDACTGPTYHVEVILGEDAEDAATRG